MHLDIPKSQRRGLKCEVTDHTCDQIKWTREVCGVDAQHMRSHLISKVQLQLPSFGQTGGWTSKRYQLVRAIIAFARHNGATKDCNSCSTQASNMSDDEQLTEDQRVIALEERFPNSPYSERLRFLRACKGSLSGAIVKLQAYYDWREIHGLDLPEYADARSGHDSDEQDWLLSCKKAVEHIEKVGRESPKKKSSGSTKSLNSHALPQIVFAYTDENGLPMTSKSGRRLLHVMPSRINKKLASAETYALALSLYLDHKQDRNKLDLFFVMLDVRPGKGWANPPAYNMMPFIKAVGNLLHQHYPERLDKLFLYPLPRPALWIWEMVKPFLDPSVVESAHLVAGRDTVAAPPPNHALCNHVDEDLLELMESTRIGNFIDRVQA